MSKTSRRKKAQRRLDSAMGNYNTMSGKGTGFNKPGSNKLKV